MSGLTEKHLSFTGKERLAATGGQPYVWVFALAVVAVCIIRYAMAPSFWLDEAHVALTLRNPSLDSIFGRLERGFYFPRLYQVVAKEDPCVHAGDEFRGLERAECPR